MKITIMYLYILKNTAAFLQRLPSQSLSDRDLNQFGNLSIFEQLLYTTSSNKQEVYTFFHTIHVWCKFDQK